MFAYVVAVVLSVGPYQPHTFGALDGLLRAKDIWALSLSRPT
jgi:hypothetical protein